MRIQTGEKIYWGIVLSLIALIAIYIYTPKKLDFTFNGKRVDGSRTKIFIVFGSIIFGFFFLIGLIARLLGNKEKE